MKKNFEIILDADDVLIRCNEYALELLAQKNPDRDYSMENIKGWGLLGIPEDGRFQFFEQESFYDHQEAYPGADDFLAELMKRGNVTIMTAVYPQFMGNRVRRLLELFPFFPADHIIMGNRKDLIQADVILDDGLHNLASSGTAFPVLFRRPWNRNVSGICAVSNYDEFLALVDIMTGNMKSEDKRPKAICIVGPSGSGKHELADLLCLDSAFQPVKTYTTCEYDNRNTVVTEDQFIDLEGKTLSDGKPFFLETTWYCGERYALPRWDVEILLNMGDTPVIVMDISGCLAVHAAFPGQCRIIYVRRDRKECIRSILDKPLNKDYLTDRILAIEFEERSAMLADIVVDGDDLDKALDRISAIC